MWPCYGVHITVCMARLICTLSASACIHALNHPYGVDFFLEIFFMETLQNAVMHAVKESTVSIFTQH